EVGHADFEIAAKVHLIRLDDTLQRILDGPHHARQHRHAHLQARRSVVRDEIAGLVNRKLRAVPIGILLVPGEEHAELIDTVDDFLVENSLRLLQAPVVARELVYGENGIVAGVIGVVDRGAVDHLVAVAKREVIGDGDRFAVRDQEAVEMPGLRRPRAYARARTGLHEIDGALTAELVATSLGGKRLLMRPPAELGRLRAFGDETIDGPGVHELLHALRHVGDLRIALRNVNDLDLQLVRKRRPLLARARLTGIDVQVRRDIEQRLLDE